MELNQAIKNRRSVRKFLKDSVSREIIEQIIEAGQNAPSHCNTQGWKYILIDDDNIKNKIFDGGGSPVIKDAPYGILVLYDKASSDNLEYSDYIQSAAASIENMLLKIHELNMGACWICHLPRKKFLIKLLKIKKPYTPIAYIALGHKASQSEFSVQRKNKIGDIYAVNEFPWPERKTPLSIIAKRTAKKIYFLLPTGLKKLISPLADKLVKKFPN